MFDQLIWHLNPNQKKKKKKKFNFEKQIDDDERK